MAENKMEQVAQMFGKKLGEEFNAKKKGAEVGNQVMFSSIGVVYVDVPEDKQNWLLAGLLTGEYEIVEDKDNENGRQDSKISSSGRV